MGGCIAFARLLFVVALFEIIVSGLAAIIAPEPMPLVMRDLATFMRAIYGGVAALLAARFVAHAAYTSAQPFALAATTCFVLAALAGALPFFAVVPAGMDDAFWDALLQLVRVAAFVAGLALSLWTIRSFAQHVGQTGIARTATWLLLPLLACLPTAFQAIDGALVPTLWLGPALAVVLPLALAAAGVIRWDVALWSVLGIAALGGILLFPTPSPLAAAAVGVVGVFALTALTLQAVFFELAMSARNAPSDTVSRTLLRGMMGSLGNDGSRIGDLDPNASRPPDEAAEDAESLARAYRELGIETHKHLVLMDDEPAPPATILPLVPKRVSLEKAPPAPEPEEVRDDGRLAPVVVLPVAWGKVYDGFAWIFGALVARVLLSVFGLLLSAPLGDTLVAVLLFDACAIGSSVCLARGLHPLRNAPLESLRKLGTLAFGLAVAMASVELVGSAMRWQDVRDPFVAGQGLIGLATLATYLVVLMRLNAHLRLPKVQARARGTLVLLAVWSAFLLATAVTTRLAATDLRWLSFPLGFATAAVGLGLWIGILWLTRDTQEALRP